MSLDYRIEMMMEDEFLRLIETGMSEEEAMTRVEEMSEDDVMAPNEEFWVDEIGGRHGGRDLSFWSENEKWGWP